MIKIKEEERKFLEKMFSEYSCVIVTGASSGIGSSLLFIIGSVAENILIFNLSRKKSLFFSGEGKVVDIGCDLSDIDEIDVAYEKIVSTEGWRDKKILLINNAGYGGYGEFPAPSLEHNIGIIDVNIRGLTYLSGKFLPYIKEGGGGIINVASIAAWEGCPYLNVYSASKAYVLNFSLGLSEELRRYRVGCTCICPGPTSTNFFRAAGFSERPLPSGYGHSSDEVAMKSLLAYGKKRDLYVVGIMNRLMTYIVHILPKVLAVKVSGYVLRRVRGNRR